MGFFGLLMLAALAVSGCGDDAAPPAPVVATPDLVRCDIATSPCQTGIYGSVAALLEAEGYPMPAIRTISVEQHAEEVRAGLDLNDLTGEDAVTRGLRLLGFIPEATDSLTAAQADYFITQVAAYYSRNARAITVVDRDYEPGSAQVILAHEFIHAIQDSQFDLSTVTRGATTEDGVIGVRSVIEGDAVHSSFAWYYETTSSTVTEDDWAEIHAESTMALRERVADPEIALIDTASSFPYSFGFQLMTETSLAGGLDARAAAFESPPGTTAEVLAGYGTDALPFDPPAAAHPAPTAGTTLEDANRYGAWYVYGFLVREGMPDDDAWATALGWVGDELAIYGDGEEVVAVWRVRFEDAADAAALSERINGTVSSNIREAVTSGEDAFVIATESAEALVAWLDQPLDEMTAAVAIKDAIGGGSVSGRGCTLLFDERLFNPRARLQK